MATGLRSVMLVKALAARIVGKGKDAVFVPGGTGGKVDGFDPSRSTIRVVWHQGYPAGGPGGKLLTDVPEGDVHASNVVFDGVIAGR